MKSINLIIIAAAITGIFSQSCRKGSMWGIRGEGAKVSETKDLKNFNAIDISMDVDITYVQDSIYSVEVTAQQNILAIMDLKVTNNVLSLDFKRNLGLHESISMTIHSPNMNRVHVSGSGSFNAINKITGTNLDLDLSGSGNISITTVSLQSMSASISGDGTIRINGGVCKNENFDLSGSGDILTEFVNATNGRANVSGIGSIVINASETLDANISGSGSVKYKGNPVVTSKISGTGKLVHLN